MVNLKVGRLLADGEIGRWGARIVEELLLGAGNRNSGYDMRFGARGVDVIY